MTLSRLVPIAAILALSAGSAAAEDDRAAVAAPAGTVVDTLHAVGAQVYVCKADAAGHLVWTFREPVATLIRGGKTVGRHYAGPTWEMADGSAVVGKVVAKAPGETPADIPWLKLAVGGDGVFADVVTIQRIATKGGNKDGACSTEGALAAEPYAADYVFSK